MKVNPRIVILLLFCIPLYAEDVPGDLPTEEQINKLVAAAWKKEPPHSVDITLYKEITKPLKSVEEFRQMFERVFEKTDGPKENLSGWKLESFNKNVQLNVERAVKEQEANRKVKQRIRINGHRQRIDQVIGWPKMILLEGTPQEKVRPEVVLDPNTAYDMTLVNSGDERKGDYTSFAYYHENKSAQITNNRKSMWGRSDIIDFAVLAFPFQGFLGINEGTVSEPVFVPDSNKMEKLRKTSFVADGIRLTISPDPNNPNTRDQIKIETDEHPCGTVMICDREDYSHIYYIEVCMPTTGKPLYIKECNDFDSQGFPRKISVTEYELDGSFKKKEVYEIVDVSLNPVIPDEVFEFNPPADYEIVEISPDGTSRVIREKGGIDGAMRILLKAQKEKDVETLKGLLGHEIWQVRLRSIQVLEKLLVQDKEGLKEIATILKNDENTSVREQAGRILHRIEAIELKASPSKQ